ncbi:MAG: DEAD/DEAH box helicase [Archaeoglobaceae archaeon]
MDISDLFCERCGRLKRRCACHKETVRQKNLRLLREVGYKEFLVPLFDCDDEIVLYRVFEPYRDTPSEGLDFLPEFLARVLRRRGIERLYPFQKEAMIKLMEGKNVVVTAPTGFGKTEAFVIPMLYRIAGGGRAMIFYPTKALARDQELKIKEYASTIGLRAVRFDGDSDADERRAVFSLKADIILTNPDMVDFHLRNTPAFRRFVRDVRFVAVDELHVYTGLLGTNMHYLMRRLSRFADFQIACASATLANAKDFAEELFEREFVHVHGEHRKGTLNFIMRYTPSIYASVRDIVKALRGRKIIVFGNSYKSVETMNWVLRRAGIRAAVHKSGLPRGVRERVEREFREGKLNVVVATPTLELGIDVGDVDVVISELVPYSQFLQRVGRAGRKGQESIGVLLLRADDSISTYYKNKPEDYFRDESYGFVEKMNEEVAMYHIASMCIERAASLSELRSFEDIVAKLAAMGVVEVRKGRVYATARAREFLRDFNMRGIGESVKIYCEGELIGERVLPIAVKELFPGGVIIHNGERYRSLYLDLKSLVCEVEKLEAGEEITDPLYTSIPRIISVEESRDDPVDAHYCTMEITLSVYGYIERNAFDRERKSYHYLDEAVSYSFVTKGFVFSAPFPEPDDYEDYYAGSFHALEHVIIEASDALTGGGSREMGGISTPEGDIFVYDAVKGGSGMSKLLFRKLRRAFEIAHEVLKSCECQRVDGCPRCTYSYQCGNNNQPLNRIGAMRITEKVLKGEKRKTNWQKYKEVVEFRYFPRS